jgi:hypothetical protein
LFTFPGDDPTLCASFRKIWPVDDMQDRMLGPRREEAKQTQRKIVEKKCRARSAKVIADNRLIPTGAKLSLSLSTYVAPDVVAAVERWLGENSERVDIRWQQDRAKPLQWAYDPGHSLGQLAGLPSESLPSPPMVKTPIQSPVAMSGFMRTGISPPSPRNSLTVIA